MPSRFVAASGLRPRSLSEFRARPVVAWLAFWACLFAAAALPAQFVDVAESAGLNYRQHLEQESPNCLFSNGSFCEPERMTGGVAIGDIDQDGWLDLYFTRLDDTDLLFRNQGDGTFEDVTAEYGLAGFDRQTNGAVFVDLDNDGLLELYVTVLGDDGQIDNNRNYLFVRDRLDEPFREEALARGAANESTSDHSTYSVAIGDFDRDGYLDLHTNEWIPTFPSNSRLLRNRGVNGPGTFADVTLAAGVEMSSRYAFASAFTDLDRDGWPDLAVAADFGTSALFWNNRDGTFREGTLAAGVGKDENGMGSTLGDFDGDGDLDWFVTSIWDPFETCDFQGCNWGYSGNRLYRYDGDRTFTDATDLAGVREGGWGWGASFFDADNDGDLDLAMTNGVDFPGGAPDEPFNTDPMRFWVNLGGGAMLESSSEFGLTDRRSGKAMATFDYDNDGDLDLLVVNNGSSPLLFRNDAGNQLDFLRVQTFGTLSNREGYGATVVVRQEVASGDIQMREIGTATHFLGQSERTAHFGLGVGSLRAGADPVERVLVRWPSGEKQRFENVPRNVTWVVVERVGACAVSGSRQVATSDLLGAPLDADANGFCDAFE